MSRVRTEASNGGTSTSAGSDMSALEVETDCFWPLLYSLFDILAHGQNVVWCCIKSEAEIAFSRSCTNYNSVAAKHKTLNAVPATTRTEMTKVRKRHYHKRLVKYRNCVIHRRTVALSQDVHSKSVTRAYSTSAGTVLVSEVLICDDPDAKKPGFGANRKLLKEIDLLWLKTCKDVKELVEKL